MADLHSDLLQQDFGGFDTSDDNSFLLEQLPEYPGKNRESFLRGPTESLNDDLGATQTSEKHTIELEDLSQQNSPDFTASTENSVAEEVVRIDEDLLRMIREDAKPSRIKPEKTVELQDSLLNQPDYSNLVFDIEELEDITTVDLSSISAERPSQYHEQDTSSENESQSTQESPKSIDDVNSYSSYAQLSQHYDPTETVASQISSQDPAIAPIDNVRKLNYRFLWYAVASVAALIALVFGGYMLAPKISRMLAGSGDDSTQVANHSESAPTKNTEQDVEGNSKSTLTGKDEQSAAGDNKIEPTDAEITAIPDAVLAEAVKDKPNALALEAKGSRVQQSTNADKHNRNDAEKQLTSVNIAEKKSKKDIKAVEKKQVASLSNRDRRQSSQQSVSQKEQSVDKRTISDTPKSKSRLQNNTSVSSPTSNENRGHETLSSQAVYTVQVYSSPSKSDADRRLTLLQSSGINGLAVSTQLVRDKTWYRVRFGSFSTRDEAEQAVRTLGLEQCWIDRVR